MRGQNEAKTAGQGAVNPSFWTVVPTYSRQETTKELHLLCWDTLATACRCPR